MTFHVDSGLGVPPYEQLRLQIIAAVTDGELAPGAKLPTVRGLAVQLDLAPNTVARAYRELEHEGVIETRGRLGSFVTLTADSAELQARRAAAHYAERISQLGIDHDHALALVSAALQPRV